MKISRIYLKNVIIEEIENALNEANNFDSKTGQPLTDDAWVKGKDNFFNTAFGKMWFQVHKQNGGKFDSKTGIPVGGLKDVPANTWHQIAPLVNQQDINSQKAKKEMDDYYDKKFADIKQKIAAEDEKIKKLKSDEEAKMIKKLGGGKFVDGKYVPPDRNDSSQNAEKVNAGKEQLQLVAQELEGKFNLQKNLQVAFKKAPEKPTAIEKQKFNEIVQPYFDEVDKMQEKFDAIVNSVQTPQDFTQKVAPFLNNEFTTVMSKRKNILNKFFWEVKNAGAVLSKPYLQMIIDDNNEEVKYLQKKMEQLDKYNTY